ncbi:hypothetical protein HDK90DRAFT_302486 [Phyllosticta capitalensis]|uniref:Lebercilin domain-containing protein n=1 Tax=Phyllosticta capitalensis TaxID=121624 RepID=A0ABR1YKT1_9PEZI
MRVKYFPETSPRDSAESSGSTDISSTTGEAHVAEDAEFDSMYDLTHDGLSKERPSHKLSSSSRISATESVLRAQLRRLQSEKEFHVKKIADQGRLIRRLSDAKPLNVPDAADMQTKLRSLQEDVQRERRVRLQAETSCKKMKLAHSKNIAFQKHQINTLLIQNTSKTEQIKAMRKDIKRLDKERQHFKLKYEVALFWDTD